MLAYFSNYETVFTDGPKDGDTAGSACVTPSDTYKSRLPENASIFSAETKAIDLALDHIEQSRNTDFVIFSDSLSVLQSLYNLQIENPLLLDVLLKHNDLANLNHIVFVGFPVMLGLKATKKPTSLQNQPELLIFLILKFLSLILHLAGGGRVVRWCWVNFQCRGVLQFGFQ